MEEQMHQLGLEGIGVPVRGEIAVLPTPSGDGARDPSDELPDGVLSLERPQCPPKIFLDDDVRGQLRPGLRDLNVLLLEDRLSLLVGDQGGARFPLDFVEGIDPWTRVQAGEGQTAALRRAQAPRARLWGAVKLRGPRPRVGHEGPSLSSGLVFLYRPVLPDS